jgi:hypothetical protein
METLFWFVLEAAIAIVLVVGIVWWTWPRRGKDDDDD